MEKDTKKILGLDLGTNSIGWALVEIDHKSGNVKILGLGSRILPMNAEEVKKFKEGGKIDSTAAQRTDKRGVRRQYERYLLRRDRLHLVLNLLNALPAHYKLNIQLPDNNIEKGKSADGKFVENKEPKLAYLPKQKGEKAKFLFLDSYMEMLDDIGCNNIKNEKWKRIPYDWTLYYLRQKALTKKISLEELAWVLLSYNQKRGYEKNEVEDKSTKENEIVEELDLRVKEVIPGKNKLGEQFYEVRLDGNDNFIYNELSDTQMSFEGDLKEVIKKSKVDEQGNVDKKKTEFTIVDIYPLTIKDVKYRKEEKTHKYTLTFQTGWQEVKTPKSYTFKYKRALDKKFDYITETVYDIKGDIKPQQGKDRKLREPDFSEKSSDWTLLKKKTEKEALIFNSKNELKNDDGSAKKYISPKIYDVLKNDAISGNRTKIIGGIFQVVERDFYREELNQIVKTQKQFHTNLKDTELIEQCAKTLYPKNENHRQTLLENKDTITQLLVEDILLYHRPLKSKKSEIGNCKYEISYWKDVVDDKTGEIVEKKEPFYKKVVSASHPYFQEFRIWDKIHNLKIFQLDNYVDKETGEIKTNVDVTNQYLKDEEDYYILFEKLNNQKSLSQKQFLKFYKLSDKEFVWNFPEDEEIKGNETRVSFATRFKRNGFTQEEFDAFLTQEKEVKLWHYLYSVSYKERTAKDKNGNENKSLRTFFDKFLDGNSTSKEVKEKLIDDFANYPKFTSRYCAYSEKALKKIVPFFRLCDKHETDSWENEVWYMNWKKSLIEREQEILKRTKSIDFAAKEIDYSRAVITEVDFKNGELPFPKGLFNTFGNSKRKFENVKDFSRLNLTQASYLIYGRHSELAEAKFWESPKQIREELHKELKQHSLNNPVAEKVLLEMLQVVADIWEQFGEQKNDKAYEKGEGYSKLFDRIHLEVGRELKKNAKEKENESKRMSGNRAQNKRLRQILEEFLVKEPFHAKLRNTDHFERLKIVEEGAEHTKNIDKEFFKGKKYSKKEIEDILKKTKITQDDFDKYRLWLEQGYQSPYSGKPISLSNLFEGAKYNIDHIFPQASVTNDSLSNKVVVEVELNKLKSDRTARAFIQEQKGKSHEGITVCSEEEYKIIVNRQFSGTKKFILLSKEIPEGFTNSQLNNARHIARKAMELLSHIVREKGEVEFRSKNVLPVTGRITSELKKEWKLNEVWTELVSTRFIRMNKLTDSKLFGEWQTSKANRKKKYFDCNLDKILRDKDESYDIKRIDHRHHALDALIIALCIEDHVNYINNINANTTLKSYGKQKQLEAYRSSLKKKIKFTVKEGENEDKNWRFMFPGEKRKDNAENSKKDSVLVKNYYFKEQESYNGDYKRMVLTALQNTIVTFKQNQRVINRTVNKYWAYKDEDGNSTERKNLVKQKGIEVGNKTNWAIRRSLGKETYYGRVDLRLKREKKLHSAFKDIFNDFSIVVDKEIKEKLKQVLQENNLKAFSESAKELYPDNPEIELYYFSDKTKDEKKIASREWLSEKFNTAKIEDITDTGIQKILLNHLKQFDTIELPFEEAIKYLNAILEKPQIEAIVNDEENGFTNVDELIIHLRENEYKFDKTDYSKLNVFIEKVTEREFRSEKTKYNKDKYKEHPELAFTPEEISEMNKPENIKKLNINRKGEEVHHAPIKKVRISRGFGNQRALNPENELSVKSKQYVVNDSGSNLYLGVYEREYEKVNDEGIMEKVKERKFKDINLMDLIEVLKLDKENRHHPLPDKIYDDKQNEFKRIFSLSPLDLVYVPTKDEMEDESLVDFDNLNKEQVERIYKYVDGGKNSSGNGYYAKFIPYSIANPIWRFHGKKNKEVFKELKDNGKIKITEKELIQNEFGLGSQENKNQNTIDNELQVKRFCWKLRVNRLGKIIGKFN